MKLKIYSFLLAILATFFLRNVSAQNKNDFRSNTVNANWSEKASWERYNGTRWVKAITAASRSGFIFFSTWKNSGK